MTEPVPIHVNASDEVQVNALFEISAYIKAHPELTADEINVLRAFIHNVRGDAQHDRDRRAEIREPKDPHDWGRS